jgi:protoporphyrinogen/coproporphyrinogen III oxidase
LVIIIGAGISGLTLGYALQKQGVPVLILESSNRVGGAIETIEPRPGYYLTLGANTIFTDAELNKLFEQIGLGPYFASPKPATKDRFILQNGAYKALPGTPIQFLLSSYFTFSEKRRILAERSIAVINTETGEKETVAQFFERRFGASLVEKAVQPFVAGIYAGDANSLLMSLTFPSIQAMEQEYGSVLKGLGKAKKTAKRRETMGFVYGTGQLTDALALMGAPIELNTTAVRIESVSEPHAEYEVFDQNGNGWKAAHVIITTPAYVAAPLLRPNYPILANTLESIEYPEVCQVHLAYAPGVLANKLKGFGGLHPPNSGTFTSGVIWVSNLFDNRAPMYEDLLCAFCGGVSRPSTKDLSDAEIIERITKEVETLYGATKPPELMHIMRWTRAIPQYNVHLQAFRNVISELEGTNIHLLTNYTGGVSVYDCMQNALKLAGQLAKKLAE